MSNHIIAPSAMECAYARRLTSLSDILNMTLKFKGIGVESLSSIWLESGVKVIETPILPLEVPVQIVFWFRGFTEGVDQPVYLLEVGEMLVAVLMDLRSARDHLLFFPFGKNQFAYGEGDGPAKDGGVSPKLKELLGDRYSRSALYPLLFEKPANAHFSLGRGATYWQDHDPSEVCDDYAEWRAIKDDPHTKSRSSSHVDAAYLKTGRPPLPLMRV